VVPELLLAAVAPGWLAARRAPVQLVQRASARRRLKPDHCLTRTITVERETKERSGVGIA